jgi:hypothetical protein
MQTSQLLNMSENNSYGHLFMVDDDRLDVPGGLVNMDTAAVSSTHW